MTESERKDKNSIIKYFIICNKIKPFLAKKEIATTLYMYSNTKREKKGHEYFV